MKTNMGMISSAVLLCMLCTLCAAEDSCKWEEKAGIALEQLKSPAMVLREYSDVTSSRDCYQKCCDLKTEGCNVAVFLSYDAEVVCMNIKCEPFDSCLWRPYEAAIAAVNEDNTFTSLQLNHTKTATTLAPSVNATNNNGVQTTQSPIVSSNETTEGTTQANSLQYVTNGESATNSSSENNADKPSQTPFDNSNGNTNNGDNFGDNNNNNAFNQDNNNGGQVDENNLGSDSNVNSNFQDGTSGNRTAEVYLGDEQTPHRRVNYTVSITIGVLTCVAFLGIMYVAAKKLNIFQDRSKYSRLLENPEQYADNYSEFEE